MAANTYGGVGVAVEIDRVAGREFNDNGLCIGNRESAGVSSRPYYGVCTNGVGHASGLVVGDDNGASTRDTCRQSGFAEFNQCVALSVRQYDGRVGRSFQRGVTCMDSGEYTNRLCHH